MQFHYFVLLTLSIAVDLGGKYYISFAKGAETAIEKGEGIVGLF